MKTFLSALRPKTRGPGGTPSRQPPPANVGGDKKLPGSALQNAAGKSSPSLHPGMLGRLSRELRASSRVRHEYHSAVQKEI